MGPEQRQNRRRVGLLGVAVAVLAGGCGGSNKGANAPAVDQDVRAFSFADLEGGQLSLAKLQGKVVVLHLFTTWSVPSQVDVQQMQAMHARGRRDVAVIGVALDQDGGDLVGPWVRGMSTKYPVVLASAALRNGKSVLGRIRRVPTTLVVNRHGRVRNRVERQLQPQELSRLVEAARRAR